MLETIRKDNPGFTIHGLMDPSFALYGRILTEKDYDFSSIVAKIRSMDIPASGSVYFPSCEEAADTDELGGVSLALYGGMPVQVGYAGGASDGLTFLEFHQGSETVVWLDTEYVAFLGHIKDIKDCKIPAGKLEAFYIPSGSVTEFYGGTLHGMPYIMDNSFRLGVTLPYGTNFPLRKQVDRQGINGMIANQNTWLVYPEGGRLDTFHLSGKGV